MCLNLNSRLTIHEGSCNNALRYTTLSRREVKLHAFSTNALYGGQMSVSLFSYRT
jgi:hypothetical protein